MKNFKRKLAGLLVFAMVLGIMAPSVVARAAEDDKPSVSITLGTDSASAWVTGASGYTVEYTQYIGKVASATGSACPVTGKITWETAEKKKADPTVDVDLSWAKKKESAIIFKFTKKGAEDYYVTKSLNAQPKAIKVGLAAATDASIKKGPTSIPEDYFVGSKDTGYLYFYDSNNTAISPATILSNKGLATNLSLKKYMAKGTTFSFYATYTEETDGSLTWPSKPAKYAYKKQANAPKVSFDVSKHTVNLKKGQEYQVIINDEEPDVWYKVDDYNMENNKVTKNRLEELVVNVPDGKDAKPNYLTEDQLYSGDVVVKVRVAANTKAPSKIATLPVKVVATGTSVDFTVGAASTDSIQVAYTAVDTTKGITVKNTTGSAYEVAVVASEAGITAKTKWTALAKKGEKKDTVKLATKNITDPVVYVRQAGVKATKAKGSTPATEAQLSGYAKEFRLNGENGLPKPDPRVSNLEVTPATGVTKGAVTLATGGATGNVTIEVAAASGGSVTQDTTVTLTFSYEDLMLTKDTAVTITGTKKNAIEAKADGKIKATENTCKVTITIKKDSKTGKQDLEFAVNKLAKFKVTIDVKDK